MISATSLRAAPARSRHQPSGREPMTLLPSTKTLDCAAWVIPFCGLRHVAGAARNLRARARPGPRARGREHPLDERPIEPRVVRDDEPRALDERARRLDVNPVPANVVVREARQVRDFGRKGSARVVAVRLRLVVEDLDDGSREGDQPGGERHRVLLAGGLALGQGTTHGR